MMSRRQALIETALVFAVFFLQGAWPVPDVNEPQYLGKAIHFWNPNWAGSDFFFNTADSHWVFYWTTGWLSLWLSPRAVAWTLRTVTWGLLAWAWRRLSVAVIPRPWFCLLTAPLFLFLLQHFAMAGEWVVGGAEAKGFAYVLVLLGLEAVVRNQWRRTWLWLGGASALHVLVGGWSAVAAGATWLMQRLAVRTRRASPPAKHRPSSAFRSMAPAIVAGLLLAAPGLVPALVLDGRADRAEARQAHEIYVFERLPHHLDPFRFPADKVIPFLLLSTVWLLLAIRVSRKRAALASPGEAASGIPPGTPWVVFPATFVHATLAIALAGLGLRFLGVYQSGLAAGLLRFYWFRLSDVAVPLGVTLVGVGYVAETLTTSHLRRWCLAAMVLLAAAHEADCLVLRLFSAPPFDERLPNVAAWRSCLAWVAPRHERPIFPRQPRADRLRDFASWKDACTWVADSGQIPSSALFLTPRMSQTFKWYTGRGEVNLHATGDEPPDGDKPPPRWHDSLVELGAEGLRRLGAKYGAQFVITEATEPRLPLPIVYDEKGTYVIYRLQ
ncbi:MAG: DUF6798 domain-containing protein [Thermoguttaceae bacterium]